MNIGLLGGTFNPPHIGHVMIAQQVLDFTDCDEVWFVPNYQQNPPKPTADAVDRLAMTRMIDLPRTRVSTIEIDKQLDGRTINLLPHLPPEYSYRFIIGSDQLPTFHLWGEWEELLRRIPFLVFPRYGFPNEPLYPGMTVVGDPAIVASNVSSTKIRERVARGLSVSAFVPVGIGEYIKTKHLYGA
jgi:nicotinate-nucleotide adenylyltransferase